MRGGIGNAEEVLRSRIRRTEWLSSEENGGRVRRENRKTDRSRINKSERELKSQKGEGEEKKAAFGAWLRKGSPGNSRSTKRQPAEQNEQARKKTMRTEGGEKLRLRVKV